MPVIDPLNPLRPRSDLLPKRYPIEGLRVEVGASVEAFRQELRLANIVCVGFNCVKISGTTDVIYAVPQFSNDGASWRNVGRTITGEFIRFLGSPVVAAGDSGLGYVQAFVGYPAFPLNPLLSTDFAVPAGARFFRVLLTSPASTASPPGASGVFDVIGTAFLL